MNRRRFLGSLAASAAVPAVASRANAASLRTTGAADLSPAGKVNAPGASEVVVDPDGETVYAAAYDSLTVLDCSDPSNPTVQTELSLSIDGTAFESLQDVCVSGDRALVAGPPGGAREGEATGAVLVDVSDPANPEKVAGIPTDHGVHNLYLDGDTAYLTGTFARGEPVLIYDVSDDDPEKVAEWSVFDENLGWSDVQNPTFYNCHDVFVQNDRLYVAQWDAGTFVLDVSDPAQPSVTTHLGGIDPESVGDAGAREAIQLPGNSHYARPSPDGELIAVGREAFDLIEDDGYSAPGGIAIYDASGSEPERVTSLKPPTVENSDGEEVSATAHNFGFRGRTMYASWYASGVHVYDLSDPANPAKLGSWADPDQATFWTARPLSEGFVASSISVPSAPREENQNRANAYVYAFPEPSGDAEPAETWEVNDVGMPLDAVDNTTTTTPESTPATSTTQSTTATTSTTTTTTTTTAPTSSTSSTDPTTDEGTDGGVPGFGVGAAVAGGALAALHRLRDGDEE